MSEVIERQHGEAQSAAEAFNWKAWVAQENKLEAALAEAQARLDEAERQVQQTGRAVGDEEAASLLSGEPVSSEPARAYQAALAILDAAKRGRASLRRAQLTLDDEVLQALNAGDAEVEAYAERTIAEFTSAVLAPAAEAWRAVLRQTKALESALGGVRVPLPDLGVEDWQGDPAARELHARHSGLRVMAGELERHRSAQARRRQERAAEERVRQPFDGSEGARLRVTARDYRLNGQLLEPGSIVVIGTDISAYHAERAYIARKVLPVREEE